MKNKKFDEIGVINDKKNGMSLIDLMEKYDIKSTKTIYDIIKRNGREHLIPNKKYQVNENYFEKIDTEEKAYWLGFIYADGYVRMKDNRSGELKIKLNYKDKGHLELFKKHIMSNHKIKDGIGKLELDGRKYESRYSSLSIYNTKLVRDLEKIGCVNNKTFIIEFPNWMREDLKRHFIRGYFDGDGSIYKVKNRPNSFNISICGNDYFIEKLLEYLKYGKIYKQNKISILTISKINDVKKFRDLIYYDSNVLLERKNIIFEKIKNDFKRDYTKTNNKKSYIIYDKECNVYIVDNLKKFCLENNLKYSTISNLSRGIGNNKEGWKIINKNN